MPVTKDDIRAEHEAAMASLTGPQRAALKRISRSFQEARFNNQSAKDMLDGVFEAEAQRRNNQDYDKPDPVTGAPTA